MEEEKDRARCLSNINGTKMKRKKVENGSYSSRHSSDSSATPSVCPSEVSRTHRLDRAESHERKYCNLCFAIWQKPKFNWGDPLALILISDRLPLVWQSPIVLVWDLMQS
eukprot:4268173-Amphidinium_carterae.1